MISHFLTYYSDQYQHQFYLYDGNYLMRLQSNSKWVGLGSFRSRGDRGAVEVDGELCRKYSLFAIIRRKRIQKFRQLDHRVLLPASFVNSTSNLNTQALLDNWQNFPPQQQSPSPFRLFATCRLRIYAFLTIIFSTFQNLPIFDYNILLLCNFWCVVHLRYSRDSLL